MRITPGFILLLVAVVLFLLAAFAVQVGTLDLVTLGLAAFAGSFLLESWKR
jgi:thiol:disulfide interchange protein